MQISVAKTDSMAIKCCGNDSHGVTVRDLSPGHSPMGLGRSLDLRWLENWAGRTMPPIPFTVNDWEVYCGVSVISNQGD